MENVSTFRGSRERDLSRLRTRTFVSSFAPDSWLDGAETSCPPFGSEPDVRPTRLDPMRAVCCETLMFELAERLAPHARRSLVELVVHAEPCIIHADPAAFTDALVELGANAIAASRPGSPVTLDVRETRAGDVLWQIEDVGSGMSPGELFILGTSPPHARGPSARLGVPFAWGVIDRHGGLLHFESAVDVGTTASVWLPGVADSGTAKASLS